ncbi:hypothetical protein [Halobacillus sp. KGW1]|uniref:hypothetical protein n=1 Tax=Halobacillus sp. KGW1 TaxID=1793726 RepID=UPI0007834B59|nr:hypothetical protein [Halobacillus sp. KGW1]
MNNLPRRKSIVLFFTFTMLLSLLSPLSAFAESNKDLTEKPDLVDPQEDKNQPSEALNMNKETKNIADEYVVIENKKFVIENKKELENQIGKEQLKKVQEQINFTNKQLEQTDLSKADVTRDKTIKVSADIKYTDHGLQVTAASVEGKDDIEFHWTYAEVWISKSTAESTIKIGSSALSTAIGGISGKLAGAIAGSIIGGSIQEFLAEGIAEAVYFKIALLPPFHTWDIQPQ